MNVYQTLFLKRTYQVRLGILPSFCGLETDSAQLPKMESRADDSTSIRLLGVWLDMSNGQIRRWLIQTHK